ncbi:hypothetical protein SAMN02746041_01145 [Desulfacinum hydrothermale DSM 13146]|uniref:Uncharacterized protein n=1 Tax=Desulfacinum hydrothermale DSM 13146 TaxID=1121390 RepID=A0A1W1XBL9_9BACT|nr:hypothetical protein [Desulfacinum hydrothermale]SMC21184.1 hypothetical protein SAMN02746041_01145 [Desulfacinum hydrothermale DSM 13146]
MKRLWIELKPDCDEKKITSELQEIGRVEKDPENPGRLLLTFHNQSEAGIKMSCFKLQEDFISFFNDFDMVRS